MSDTYIMRVGAVGLSKLGARKPSTLQQAVRHNRRQIQAELGAHGHIDPSRTHLNETIAGPVDPDDVVRLARARMAAAGVGKLRRDHTQAVELVFSLATDTAVDTGVFFRLCAAWVAEQFGADNVLTADIHRDEAAPHCHVLVLPLVGDRMAGSELIARPATAKLHTSFVRVAKKFGLKPPVTRLSGQSRTTGAQMVLARLESTHDAVLRSALCDVVRAAIKADPAPYMAALGISRDVVKPKAVQRTMAQIFTSPGRGPKVEHPKPIGFESSAPKQRTLCSVGIAHPERVEVAPKAVPLTDRGGVSDRRRAGAYTAYRAWSQAPVGLMT